MESYWPRNWTGLSSIPIKKSRKMLVQSRISRTSSALGAAVAAGGGAAAAAAAAGGGGRPR